jgi:Peptidase M50B-like
MWLISVVVLSVVGYFVSGRKLPVEVVDNLNHVVSEDLAPSERLVALFFVVGAVVGITPIRIGLRYLSTVVHELGHAFVAGTLGGRPKSITISLNSAGLATYEVPPDWGRFRATIVSLAGYPAPAVASLAAVNAIHGGHPKGWFTFAVGTLAISIVLLIRNFWGLLWTAGAVLASFVLSQHVDGQYLALTISFVAGFLAVEGLRNSLEQFQIVRQTSGAGCDAERVAAWWGINSRIVAFGHILLVSAIAGNASIRALQPLWAQITDRF